MKKVISLFIILAMLLTMLAACSDGNKDTNETTADTAAKDTTENSETDKPLELSKDPVRIFTLMGPTGMGMAPLMESDANGEASLNYEFTVANAADEFVGNIVKGDFELACVPTNLAANLYKKTNGAIEVLAVNTLGVLYVLEDGETIESVEDLNGKTIYSAGQGAVPEYALNYILDAFGVECEVIYESEHDLVVADVMSNKADIVLLPEPKVTAALKNEKAPEGLRIALDLTELWKDACEKKGDSSELYMGCIIVNKSWAAEHRNEVGSFLMEYSSSVNTVNSNPEAASQIIAKHGIIPKAPLAQAAIPNANIVCITGKEMQTGLAGFFKVLFDYNPASVGGAVPDEEIFFN